MENQRRYGYFPGHAILPGETLLETVSRMESDATEMYNTI